MIVKIKDGDESKKRELCTYIMGLKGDKEIEIRSAPKGSSLQLYRYYGGVVLSTLSNELGYEKDEMHELLKSMFLKEIHELPNGKTEMKPRRVRTLSSEEMLEYIEHIKRWASQEFSIVIPDSE